MKPRRNPYAKALRSPHLRPRIINDAKKKITRAAERRAAIAESEAVK